MIINRSLCKHLLSSSVPLFSQCTSAYYNNKVIFKKYLPCLSSDWKVVYLHFVKKVFNDSFIPNKLPDQAFMFASRAWSKGLLVIASWIQIYKKLHVKASKCCLSLASKGWALAWRYAVLSVPGKQIPFHLWHCKLCIWVSQSQSQEKRDSTTFVNIARIFGTDIQAACKSVFFLGRSRLTFRFTSPVLFFTSSIQLIFWMQYVIIWEKHTKIFCAGSSSSYKWSKAGPHCHSLFILPKLCPIQSFYSWKAAHSKAWNRFRG